MKTRAAVAVEKAKPLEIMEVDLDGPKAGEVMVEIKATGICHTDEFTLSGADPRRIVPRDSGARGRRRRGRGRAGRHLGEERRPRHSALHAGMPAMPVLSLAQDQSLHRHPRDPGPGRDARRHLALLARRQEAPPLYGLLDLRQLHRAARDRGRQDPRGRTLRQGLLHRLRGDDRHRRGDQHRQGRARRQGGRVRAWRHRSQCDPGAQARRCRHDHRGSTSTTARRSGASASA